MRSSCERATAINIDLLLDKWHYANEPPPDDRIVLILRVSPIGVALLRDIGYYSKIDDEWYTSHNVHMHPVKFWRPYPLLPETSLESICGV